MNLYGSLMNPTARADELLAEIRVTSDVVKARSGTDGGVERTIHGTVHRLGSIWTDFFRIAQSSIVTRLADGKSYFQTRLFGALLGIDHDVFTSGAALWTEGTEIRLVIVEASYEGAVEAYPKAVEARNEKINDFLARWQSDQLTWGEAAKLLGEKLEKETSPGAVASSNVIAAAKSRGLEHAKYVELAQNRIL